MRVCAPPEGENRRSSDPRTDRARVAVEFVCPKAVNPGGISFSTYAGRTLRFRIYERQLPQFVPLDSDDGEPLAEVGSPQDEGAGDDERRLADGLRSLDARARRPPGRNHALD